MINFTVAVRTTILLVDDDIQQLDALALTMKMSGFSVVTASSSVEAISLMNEGSLRRIDVAVIDHHLPSMNGSILAAYLKSRYPELKVALYSGALDVPMDEMMSLDGFFSKSDGIDSLLSQISEFWQIDPASPTLFALKDDAFVEAVN
jgi:DNA-binding NtrC family response regulator